MRRLKKSIREAISKKEEPFTISVSKITPKFFWEPCHWCDNEFRREEGTLIILRDNVNGYHSDKGYTICEKCTGGNDIEIMRKYWEISKEFKEFKSEDFLGYLDLGDCQ